MASQNVDNSTGPDDPWGEDGDSVGVVTRWAPPNAFEGLSSDHLLRVQQRIADAAWKESSQAKDWVGFAVAEALGLDASKATGSDRARITQLLRTWISTGALVVVDPVRKDAPLHVDLPVIKTAGDVVSASAAVLASVASAEITPDEGGKLMTLLTAHRSIIEVGEMEKRISALEGRQ